MKQINYVLLGNRLKEKREESGFTQEQLEQFRRMREEQEAAGQSGQGQQRQRRRN